MKKPGPKFWWSAALTILIAIITLLLLMLDFNWLPRSLAWFATATLITALAFFVDKHRAVTTNHDHPDNSDQEAPAPAKRRIPEATLLWLCLIGGTLGGIAIMLWRRHKTRDRKFLILLLTIVVLQALALGIFIARQFAG